MKEALLVGHNIIDFDLPLLKKLANFDYQKTNIWDMLKLEMDKIRDKQIEINDRPK